MRMIMTRKQKKNDCDTKTKQNYYDIKTIQELQEMQELNWIDKQ